MSPNTHFVFRRRNNGKIFFFENIAKYGISPKENTGSCRGEQNTVAVLFNPLAPGCCRCYWLSQTPWPLFFVLGRQPAFSAQASGRGKEKTSTSGREGASHIQFAASSWHIQHYFLFPLADPCAAEVAVTIFFCLYNAPPSSSSCLALHISRHQLVNRAKSLDQPHVRIIFVQLTG